MKWFWVLFHFEYDGWSTEHWSLVAGESEEQVRANWGGPNVISQAIDVVPARDVKIPRTPRRTTHPRLFNPRSPR